MQKILPKGLSLSRTSSSLDFTLGDAYGSSPETSQSLLSDNFYGLFSGDVDASGSVNAGDRATTWNERNTTGYLQADTNLDGSVNAADRANTWNNRNNTTDIP